MSDAVTASGQILQIGSQQRSWKQFHRACELVRNGRIGEIKHVEIGLPGDPAGGDASKMPVPAGFQVRRVARLHTRNLLHRGSRSCRPKTSAAPAGSAASSSAQA